MSEDEKKKGKYVELQPFILENINNGDLVNQINLPSTHLSTSRTRQ